MNDEQREQLAELLAQGTPIRSIAAQLGISRAAAGRGAIAARKAWAAERPNLAAMLAEETAKLNAVERAAWSAYNDDPQPGYLETIVAAIKHRCRIHGVGPNATLDVQLDIAKLRQQMLAEPGYTEYAQSVHVARLNEELNPPAET